MSTPRPTYSPTDLMEAPRGRQGMSLRGMLPSLVVNAALPFVAYQVLVGRGFSDFWALTISGVFPVIGIVWSIVRTRRADMIGIISLVFIVVGVVTSLLSGDARFILIKESFLTGVFGLVCLISLLLPRPLMFYFGRQFAGGGDPARQAAFENLWQYPQFRTVNRRMTIVWGVGYLLEAAVRIALTFVLSISVFLIVSPLLAFGVTIALISWTMAYARRSARRGAERMAATAAQG
ncbi:MAG: hypothetical protein JO020_01470 [Chloroflexi bacterium]|nr:hypothetical protein [Chloroflexota bacterium]MBV9892819.1 hypothetical protein [Chloroflexota bacterium]